MKHYDRWTGSQRKRAEILFKEYPNIKQAYEASKALTDIYNEKISSKGVAHAKLAWLYDRVEKLSCKYFNSVINPCKTITKQLSITLITAQLILTTTQPMHLPSPSMQK